MDRDEEDDFKVVDSRTTLKKKGNRNNHGRNKGLAALTKANEQKGTQRNYYNRGPTKGGKRKKGGFRQYGNWNYQNRMEGGHEWAVEVNPDWVSQPEILLNNLGRIKLEPKASIECEDLRWCGTLRSYDRAFDKITVKTARNLRRFEKTNFYRECTLNDNVMEKLVADENERHKSVTREGGDPGILVACSDQILALLMSASRSQLSWDIRVTRKGDIIILDKRSDAENSVDMLTVNENSGRPLVKLPDDVDLDKLTEEQRELASRNSPQKLGFEATCINQNFSQQVLMGEDTAANIGNPYPFEGSEEFENPLLAFRYRKFTLTSPKSRPITFIVRTEIDAKVHGKEDEYISVKALNEYIPGECSALDWRKSLGKSMGALMATEIKNNSSKISRWVVRAMLGGVNTLKLGFISRVKPSEPWKHDILGLDTFKITNLASQIGLIQRDLWAVARTFVEGIMDINKEEDILRLIFLKDPKNACIKVYEVDEQDFDDDDEDSDDE